jgi:hypothetical protein
MIGGNTSPWDLLPTLAGLSEGRGSTELPTPQWIGPMVRTYLALLLAPASLAHQFPVHNVNAV